MVAATPTILAAEHPFLKYDSQLDCSVVFAEHTAESVATALSLNPGAYLGDLHQNARASVVLALTGNKFIKRGMLPDLLREWHPQGGVATSTPDD